jgi:hypothetical protein
MAQQRGRPVENWELWKDFLSSKANAGVRVDICKVKNKSTPLLQRVDKLAKSAGKSHPRIDRGLVVGKIGRAKIKGSATMFRAAGQALVIGLWAPEPSGARGKTDLFLKSLMRAPVPISPNTSLTARRKSDLRCTDSGVFG